MKSLVHQEALMMQGCWKSRLFLTKVLVDGRALPDRKINLGHFGDISLVTIGDSFFPRFSWLIKCCIENTRDTQQRYFNKMLCSVRVVSENTYGMLKRRWHFLYKKTEAQPENLRYIIMACIALHNLCIAGNDPCKTSLAVRSSWTWSHTGILNPRREQSQVEFESDENLELAVDEPLIWTCSVILF